MQRRWTELEIMKLRVIAGRRSLGQIAEELDGPPDLSKQRPAYSKFLLAISGDRNSSPQAWILGLKIGYARHGRRHDSHQKVVTEKRHFLRGEMSKERGQASTRPAPTCLQMGRLLQRSGDVVKVGAQLTADTLHGGDNRDRDAPGNQAILDGRGSGVVLEEFRNERLHVLVRPRFGVLRTGPAPIPVRNLRNLRFRSNGGVVLFRILRNEICLNLNRTTPRARSALTFSATPA